MYLNVIWIDTIYQSGWLYVLKSLSSSLIFTFYSKKWLIVYFEHYQQTLSQSPKANSNSMIGYFINRTFAKFLVYVRGLKNLY